MIMTLFQTLLNEKEVIEDIHTKAALGDHPEGAVDLEAAKITNKT
jgi:hypothetical protein